MRFFLRPGVRFHNGSVMTADDVVFSLDRVRRPTSDHKEAMAGVKTVVKVDAMTVDVVSEKPMAPLLAHVTTLAIMSKAWLLKHGAAEPHDYAANKESYTGHHAMGTSSSGLPRRNCLPCDVIGLYGSSWTGQPGMARHGTSSSRKRDNSTRRWSA